MGMAAFGGWGCRLAIRPTKLTKKTFLSVILSKKNRRISGGKHHRGKSGSFTATDAQAKHAQPQQCQRTWLRHCGRIGRDGDIVEQSIIAVGVVIGIVAETQRRGGAVGNENNCIGIEQAGRIGVADQPTGSATLASTPKMLQFRLCTLGLLAP
jgi:hypothetical protein